MTFEVTVTDCGATLLWIVVGSSDIAGTGAAEDGVETGRVDGIVGAVGPTRHTSSPRAEATHVYFTPEIRVVEPRRVHESPALCATAKPEETTIATMAHVPIMTLRPNLTAASSRSRPQITDATRLNLLSIAQLTPSRFATSSILSSGCTTATRTLFAPPAP